jgi:hypothetical protein
MNTTFAVGLLTVSIAPWATADSSLTEAKDQKVHVWVPDKVAGRLVAFDAQTVTIQPATGEARVFERTTIEKMEKARGAGFHVGMTLAGAGAGLLTAGVVAFAVCDSRTTGCNDASWADVGVIAIGGAALGAAVLGLATRNHGWEDVTDFNHPKVSAVIVRRPRGVGVLVSVRF